MLDCSVRRYLPYTPLQLFDLVIDVERYPDFLPWWIAANVWRREHNVYYTRQTVGLPFLGHEFQSITTFSRPRHINIHSVDRPFKILDMHWLFTTLNRRETVVTLNVKCELCAPYGVLLGNVLSEESIKQLVDTFESRAKKLFCCSTLSVIEHIHGPCHHSKGHRDCLPGSHSAVGHPASGGGQCSSSKNGQLLRSNRFLS